MDEEGVGSNDKDQLGVGGDADREIDVADRGSLRRDMFLQAFLAL